MAARGVRGLSATDLDQVRQSLAAGRRPKVVFTPSAGQLAGQRGQVVELTDAAFYVATLYLPQLAAARGEPDPLIDAFLHAAAGVAP